MKRKSARKSMQPEAGDQNAPEKPTRKSLRRRTTSGGNGQSRDPDPVPKKQKLMEVKESEGSVAPESDNSTVEAPVNGPTRYMYALKERNKSMANRKGSNDGTQPRADDQLDRDRNDERTVAAENRSSGRQDDSETDRTGGIHTNEFDETETAGVGNNAVDSEICEEVTAEGPGRNGCSMEEQVTRKDHEEEGTDRHADRAEGNAPEPITYYDEDEIMVEQNEDPNLLASRTKRLDRNSSLEYHPRGSVPGYDTESPASGEYEGASETRRTALSAEIADRRKKHMLSLSNTGNSSVKSKTAEVEDSGTSRVGGTPRTAMRGSANDSQNDSRPSVGTGNSGQNKDCDETDDEDDEESPSKSSGKNKKSHNRGDTNRKKYLAIMKEKCYGIDKVITKKSVPSAIASSMIGTLYSEILSKSPMSSAVLKDMFDLMLFGKQQKAKKAQCFSSRIGEIGTLFRKKVMKNAVLHLRKGYIPDAWLGIPNKELKARPECRWVQEIVPTEAVCEMVSKVREKKGFSKSRNGTVGAIGLKRRDVNVTDKTEFVLNHVYTTVVAALNVNRKTFKRMFYGRVGYLLSKWTAVDFYSVRQEVNGMWLEAHDNRKFLRPQEIPNTKTLKDGGDVDQENTALLEKVTEERSELMLSVQHDVKLKLAKPGSSSNSNTAAGAESSEDQPFRPFRRTFSLLGIAVRMLSDLCGVPSEKNKFHVLKFHSKSLAVCYCLAIALKHIMLSCSDEVCIGEPLSDEATKGDDDDGLGPEEDGEAADAIENEEPQPSPSLFHHDVHEEMFRMLAIPRAESKTLLERYVGNVLESFWTKNHTGAFGHDEPEEMAGHGVEVETGVDVGDVDPETLDLDM